MTLAEELQRLRNEAEMVPADDPRIELLADFFDASGEAINEITRLTAENERLREALTAITQRSIINLGDPGSENVAEIAAKAIYREWKACLDIARAALETNNDAG